MSWLSDLAGKAENLLNKIDQNAAAVIHETEKKIHQSFSTELDNTNTQPESSPSFNAPISNVSKTDLNDDRKQSILKGKSLKRNGKKYVEAGDTGPRKISDLKVSPSLRTSRSAGNFTTIVEKAPQNNSYKKDEPVLLDLENGTEEEEVLSRSAFHLNGDENSSTASHSSDHFTNMENELLRNEISVVNNEVSLLIAKAKNAEKVAEEKGKRLNQMEKEFALAIKENEKLLGKILEVEKHTNEVPLDTFNTMHLEETIRFLEEEKQNLLEKVKDLERSEIANISTTAEIEADLKETEIKCKGLEEKLDKTRVELAQIQTEWKNYKIRANSTLLMKEKIIEELGGSRGENTADDLANTLNTQITQLKLERDDITAESARYQAECEKLSKELEHLETRTTSTERQLSALREAFRQEKAAKEIAEHTVNSLSKELKSMQHETAKQISSLRSKVRESQPRETDHLLSQPITSSMNVSENGEDRLRLLTQALVGKQAALESITSDRNALRLQLEKTENKYRSDLITMRNNHQRIIQVNDTDDDMSIAAKARFPPMMQENPWDSNLSRGVKKAYSTLDGFSVRVGVFLRRNPIARIFIITYMIILHFWVFVVLFTYTPEVHKDVLSRP